MISVQRVILDLLRLALRDGVRELAAIVLHSPSLAAMGRCECPDCAAAAIARVAGGPP